MTDLIKQFFNESEEPTEYYAIINRYENNEWIDCLDVFEGKDLDRAIENFTEWVKHGPDDVNICAFFKVKDPAVYDRLSALKDSGNISTEDHDFLADFYAKETPIFLEDGTVSFDIFDAFVKEKTGMTAEDLENTDSNKYDELYAEFLNQDLTDFIKEFFKKRFA